MDKEIQEIIALLERKAARNETGSPYVLGELLHEARLFRRAAELLRDTNGWQLVPVEPTADMIMAAGLTSAGWCSDYCKKEMWRLMVLHAPRPGYERVSSNAVFRRGGTAQTERQGVDPSPATHSCTATKWRHE